MGRSLYYGQFDWRGMDGGGGEVSVTHLGQATAPPDLLDRPPLSLALTEYHAVLLYPEQLLALNRVSGRVAYDVQFSGPAAPAPAIGERSSGRLCGGPPAVQGDASGIGLRCCA